MIFVQLLQGRKDQVYDVFILAAPVTELAAEVDEVGANTLNHAMPLTRGQDTAALIS